VIKKVQKIDINENIIINILFCVSLSHKVLLSHKVCMVSHKVALSHKVVLSHRVSIVSHKVVLNHKVVLSWQALFRVAQVVSLRTSGDCGKPPQPWHEYGLLDVLGHTLICAGRPHACIRVA